MIAPTSVQLGRGPIHSGTDFAGAALFIDFASRAATIARAVDETK
jgi:hypothetical protein